MEERKYKIKFIIVVFVLTIISALLGASYALLIWHSENNTELTVRIGDLAEVYYKTGPNINVSNLGPIFDYEKDGEATYFTISNYGEEELLLYATFTINTLTDNLKEESFKYVFMKSDDQENYTVVSSNNFTNVTDEIVLLDQWTIQPNTSTTFKLIFYIDGNMLNPTSMQNGNLSGVISVGSGKPIVETLLTYLSAGETCNTAPCNGLYKVESATADGGKSLDYRYIGAKVNNYVKFNDEMYRIIGIFDENSHGIPEKSLVKLIPDDLTSANSWGMFNTGKTTGVYSTNMSDWTGSSVTTGVKANLNILLNEYYFNHNKTSNTFGICSDWTYYYFESDIAYKTENCSDVAGHGIKTKYKDYIEEVTWYLKGYNSNAYSKENFYTCERSLNNTITNCTSSNTGGYPTSVNDYIGLMYISDYLYASGNFIPTDTTLGSSNNFGNTNWLYRGYEWTITPVGSDTILAFVVDACGATWSKLVYVAYGIRPTFYLKDDVLISKGNGSFTNPFILTR